MPRKCHLCASTAHSAANCHRLLQAFGIASSSASSQHSIADQKFTPSQNIKKQNGLQFILPYHHIFSVPVKGRWEGKTLAEAFRAEFSHYPIEYFEPACREGRLKLVWDLFHLRKAEKAAAGNTKQSNINKSNSSRKSNSENASLLDDGLSAKDSNSDLVEERRRQRSDEHDQLLQKGTNFDPPSQPDTTLKVGMIILHRVHRHELPVLENVCPIQIVDFVHVPVTKTTTPPNSPRNNNNNNKKNNQQNGKKNRSSRSPSTASSFSSTELLRGIIAINKPPSIPVHSCGRYHYNTVQHMLRCGFFEFEKQNEQKIADQILRAVKFSTDEKDDGHDDDDDDDDDDRNNSLSKKVQLAKKILQDQVFGDSEDSETAGLHSCHRLDRGTSGVLLFATCADVSKLVFNALSEKSEEPIICESSGSSSFMERNSNKMSKIYLARVHGKVIAPKDAKFEAQIDTRNDNNENNNNSSNNSNEEGNRFFYLQRSIYCASAKDGNFACLTAEQEEKAIKFRQEQLEQEKLLAETDEARRRQILEGNGNSSTTETMETLKREKRERQAQICKGRNARGALNSSSNEKNGADDAARNGDNNQEHVQVGDDQLLPDEDEHELKAIQFSKWAATWFRVLSYDEKLNESVVECHPVTGRTHQLRVHLAMGLNCPILGDDVYGNMNNNNNNSLRQKQAASGFDFEQDLRELLANNKNNNHEGSMNFDPAPLTPGKDFELDPCCPECTYNRQKEPHFISGGSPFIALHAWKYKIKLYEEEKKQKSGHDEFSYEDRTIMTPVPEWFQL